MANIKIKEKDLTSQINPDVTTNAVYIPGYSIMGPINTPVYCETLDDLYETFGNIPYKFRGTQTYPTFTSYSGTHDVTPGGYMYEEGDYEKSFIYAADLLKLGLPVYYERIFDTSKKTTWTASAKIHAVTSNSAVIAVPSGDEGTVQVTESVALSKILKSPSIFAYSSKLNRWTLGTESVLLSDYGLTFVPKTSGTNPSDGFQITVTVSSDTAITLSSSQKFLGAVGESVQYKLEQTAASTSTSSTRYKLTVYSPDSSGNTSKDVFESKEFVVSQQYDADKKYITYRDLPSYFTNIDISTAIVDHPIVRFLLVESPTRLSLASSTSGDEFNVTDIYTALETDSTDTFTNPYERISDVGDYNIKFITSGAYPLFEAADNVAVTKQGRSAAQRTDATALIDYANTVTRTLKNTSTLSVYNCFKSFVNDDGFGKNDLGENVSGYVSMYIPYGIFTSPVLKQQVTMPGSYAYLTSVANSVQSNANWIAVAGVKRGLVPNIVGVSQNITNAIANSYQLETEGSVAINPITNINPYGYVIWGNRTALSTETGGNLKAGAFMNVRQLVNDLKKVVYRVAKKLTFEPNSDVLWINFKAGIEPTLEKMLTGQGISKYKITRVSTTKKATVAAKIRIWPIEAVEDWDITIELADSTTTITE